VRSVGCTINMMFRRIFFLLGFAAFTLISPTPIRAWHLVDSTLRPIPLPPGTQLVEPSSSVDFDGDGFMEAVTLANGQASIQTGEQIRWQSPQAWEVRQAQIADLNHDGLSEAVLLVWRPFKPWPVDTWLPYGGRIDTFHNSAGMSCHLILIGWTKNSFRERWAGSALAEPVKSFAVANLTGSGEQFLITLESEYDDPPSAPARRLKIWEWNGFGFAVVSQMQGAFNQLTIVRANNGQLLILAP
jgi:hypothetical protein